MSDGVRPEAEDTDVFWIVQDEVAAINARRLKLKRRKLQIPKGVDAAGVVIESVGLALSGGGVRSAAVSLGVLQALNYYGVLSHIDYLSTVSGGGYMGCSLTASMSKASGEFVYGGVGKMAAGAPQAVDISDTDAVGHIRNYSNYLIPAGLRDVVTGMAIIVRGLVANLGLLLPVVLALAALTIWWKPTRSTLLEPSFSGYSLTQYLPANQFGLALTLFLVGLALFFFWAIHRSTLAADKQSEYRTNLPSWAATFLILLATTFFVEFQPFVISGMFGTLDQTSPQDSLFALVAGRIKTLAAILAPVGLVVTFFRQQLGDLLKSATDGIVATLLRGGVKALVWLAGLALPLCIWILYIYLCFWGIQNDLANQSVSDPCRAAAAATIKTANPSPDNQGGIQGSVAGCELDRKDQEVGPFAHTPKWLHMIVKWVSSIASAGLISWFPAGPFALAYLVSAVILFFLSFLLTPNANSLHRLYRDRLSKAFLFDPLNRAERKQESSTVSAHEGSDFVQLDAMLLSELSDELAPYHLINAALNIQGSDYANRRGRNADFFLFSKNWVGSVATGYAPVQEYQVDNPDLNLATAMAISGAAASSNMGSGTVRPLVPTLALLNIRLGYWLRNPAFWAPTGAPVSRKEQQSQRSSWIPRHRLKFYLWAEITGRLYENADHVYLTDGGHIENLGIYELLRRRCRVIVAVDAEADRSMHFSSLVTLQRYARIDLGIRIELPWQNIQATTLNWMRPPNSPANGLPPPVASSGPHVAVGTINYGGGDRGYLVYIKSSLTGDENDYIRDYARRNNAFPHESTGDQFFSEEQFEVYRALGFHMADGFLSSTDTIEVNGATSGTTKFNDNTNQILRAVRDMLTGP